MQEQGVCFVSSAHEDKKNLEKLYLNVRLLCAGRTQSMQSLQSDKILRGSMQSLNEVGLGRGRSRSRSRTRARTPSRGARAGSVVRGQRSMSTGRQGRSRQRAGSIGPQRRFSTGAFGQQSNNQGPLRRRRSRSVGAGNRGRKFQGKRPHCHLLVSI